jgi:hypothetical protein
MILEYVVPAFFVSMAGTGNRSQKKRKGDERKKNN